MITILSTPVPRQLKAAPQWPQIAAVLSLWSSELSLNIVSLAALAGAISVQDPELSPMEAFSLVTAASNASTCAVWADAAGDFREGSRLLEISISVRLTLYSDQGYRMRSLETDLLRERFGSASPDFLAARQLERDQQEMIQLLDSMVTARLSAETALRYRETGAHDRAGTEEWLRQSIGTRLYNESDCDEIT